MMNARRIVIATSFGFVAVAVALAATAPVATADESSVRLAESLGPIQPSITVDADGAVYVAFVGGSGDRKDIYVAVSKDGGLSFGEPVKALDVGGEATGGRQRGPRIGVDDAKRVYVSAVQQLEGKPAGQRFPQGDVWLTVSSDGGATFSGPVKCNDRRKAADTEKAQKSAKEGMHWMAVQGDGTVHLCWLDHRLAPRLGQMIAYTRVTDGGTKVAPNVIAYAAPQTVCQCCTPGLAIDARGNPSIAFRNAIAGDNQVWVARSSNKGKSFKKAAPVTGAKANITQCPMDAPSVAVTPDGKKVAVAWMDQRSGKRNTWLRLPSGKELPLANAAGAQQGHPSIALDSAGDVWAIWTEIAGGERAIYGLAPGAKRAVRLSEEADVGFPVIAWSERTGAVLAYEVGGGVVVRRWPSE